MYFFFIFTYNIWQFELKFIYKLEIHHWKTNLSERLHKIHQAAGREKEKKKSQMHMALEYVVSPTCLASNKYGRHFKGSTHNTSKIIFLTYSRKILCTCVGRLFACNLNLKICKQHYELVNNNWELNKIVLSLFFFKQEPFVRYMFPFQNSEHTNIN